MTSKIPRHILKLSTEEKRAFFESFDYIFSDIDGVVWNYFSPIKGSPEGFEALKAAGKALILVTNNSVRDMEDYERKFKKINMNVNFADLWHPSVSIVKYLKNIKFEGLIYCIGTENFKNVLRKAGYQLIDGPNEIIEESLTVMAGHIIDDQPVRAVIVDVDFNLTGVKLIRAQLYLRKPDCLFIAGATDLLLPVHEKFNIIGPGHFVRVLQDATNRKPITLGKPGADLAELIKKEFKIGNPKRALMIGDMLEQDVGFGQECGFQTLLVLSGGSRPEHLATERTYLPDYYADSVADFLELLKDIQKSQV